MTNITTNNNMSEAEMRLTNGYGHATLSKVFDMVCDPADWKGPIEAIVNGEMVNVAVEAIKFFTATCPKVELVMPKGNLLPKYLLTSPGYRMGPAGDH